MNVLRRLQRQASSRQSTRAPTPAPQQVDALTPAQALGNQFMQAIQPKLSVNAPGDAYEQEADRMASRVTSAPDVQRAADAAGLSDEKKDDAVQTKPLASQITPLVQRAPKSAPKSGDEQKKKEPPKPAARSDSKKKEPPKPAARSDSKKKDDEQQAQKKENGAPKKDDENKVAQKKDKVAPAKDDDKKKPAPKPEASKKKAEDDPVRQAQTSRRNAPQLDDEDETAVQRRPDADAALAVSPSVEQDITRMQAGGRPLDPAARGYFEPRFGADFSRVRVHDDPEAARAAESLNAQAFTQGEHIFFNSGRYQPNDTPGRQLLAHELTHTVQQGAAAPSSAAAQAKASPSQIQRTQNPPNPNVTPPPAVAPAVATTDVADAATDATQFPYEKGKMIGDTIVFDKVGIPGFKLSDHRAARYAQQYGQHGKLARTANYRRGNPDQRQVWRAGVRKDTIAETLANKLQVSLGGRVNNIPQAVNPTRRYAARVNTSSGRRLMYFGTFSELVDEMTTPAWGGTSDNPPLKYMEVDHISELQVSNWRGQRDSAPNTLANMELLNRDQNGASGTLIDNNIVNRVKQFNIDTANRYAQNAPPRNITSVRPSRTRPNLTAPARIERSNEDRAIMGRYTLEFMDAESVSGPSVGPDDFWKQDDIEAGRHLNPVQLSNFQIGSSTEVFLFSRPVGGAYKPFKTDRNDIPASEERWLYPFRVVGKSFNVGDDVDVNSETDFGTINARVDGPFFKNRQRYRRPTFHLNRIVGARYAGYADKRAVMAELNAIDLELNGASPIRIDDVDLRDNGLFIKGKIISNVPLLQNIDIDFEIEGGELRVYKTFTAQELPVPAPLRVSTASLTLMASTNRGVSADGRIDFGIDRVGQGFFAARAQSGAPGGDGASFSLTGGFDFDSRLFDPANIRMRYENGQFSGEGNIGIPEGRLRGIRSAQLRMAYAEGRLTADGTVRPNIPGVQEGTMNLVYSEQEGLVISGTLMLAPNPAIRSGSLEARVERKPDGSYKVAARGTAEPAVPYVNSQLTVAYDDGAFDAEVTADYTRGMLRGQLRVAATNRPIDPASGQPNGEPTDRITVYGGGQVTIRFSPWLQGTAGIRLLPNGEIEVSGEIGLPSAVDVFPAKRFDRNLFRINVDIPIIGVSVAGQNIGVFATIGGGLDLTAGIGPGQIRDLRLGVTYNPAHEDQTHVTGHGEFVIPADAGLRLFIRGGLGVGIPIVDATAGIEIGGQLGLEGQARAAVDVDWTPQRGVVLDAVGEIFVEPKFKFDVTAYVEVTADLVLTEIELYSQRWRLAQFEYGSNLRFGVSFPIHYEDNQPFNLSLDDLQFTTPEIEPMSVVRGLLGLD